MLFILLGILIIYCLLGLFLAGMSIGPPSKIKIIKIIFLWFPAFFSDRIFYYMDR